MTHVDDLIARVRGNIAFNNSVFSGLLHLRPRHVRSRRHEHRGAVLQHAVPRRDALRAHRVVEPRGSDDHLRGRARVQRGDVPRHAHPRRRKHRWPGDADRRGLHRGRDAVVLRRGDRELPGRSRPGGGPRTTATDLFYEQCALGTTRAEGRRADHPRATRRRVRRGRGAEPLLRPPGGRVHRAQGIVRRSRDDEGRGLGLLVDPAPRHRAGTASTAASAASSSGS